MDYLGVSFYFVGHKETWFKILRKKETLFEGEEPYPAKNQNNFDPAPISKQVTKVTLKPQ